MVYAENIKVKKYAIVNQIIMAMAVNMNMYNCQNQVSGIILHMIHWYQKPTLLTSQQKNWLQKI